MRTLVWPGFVLLLLGILGGCSNANQFPDVTDNIRKSLDQAGYKDIRVSQDREKGVITLTGTALTESDKSQAEAIVKSGAGSIHHRESTRKFNGNNPENTVNTRAKTGNRHWHYVVVPT
jgi:hypothetical protein